MPLFRFDNYATDLLPRGEWKPGDPWENHYTNPGLDDRDQQLEDYLSGLAASVGGEWTRAANQLVGTNNLTLILADTVVTASAGFALPSLGVLTVPAGQTGLYGITCKVTYAAQPLNVQFCRITAATRVYDCPGPAAAVPNQMNTIVVPLDAGDAIQFETLHNQGGNTNMTAYISVEKIR